MRSRVYLALVGAFWVAMNVLLWRSEMAVRGERGIPVSPAAVWERILTAPDDSALVIGYQGRRVGFCRWAANVGEETATGKTASEDLEPEGRVRHPSGYTLDFDGSVVAGDPPQRWRFNWRAEFGPDRRWRRMSLRLVLRPYLWETRADAAAQTVSVRADSPEAPWERTFTLAELRDPAAVLRSLGQPAALAWLTPWLAAGQGQAPKLDLRLDWDTRVDWSHLGRTRVRVYRVQARLLDKYRIDVMASRVGEILRVDLPYDIRLVNEAIAGLPEGIPAR